MRGVHGLLYAPLTLYRPQSACLRHDFVTLLGRQLLLLSNARDQHKSWIVLPIGRKANRMEVNSFDPLTLQEPVECEQHVHDDKFGEPLVSCLRR